MHHTVIRLLAFFYLLSLAALAVFVRTLDWPRIEAALLHGPACPLKHWTGLLCAFCGMTHSWIAVLKGEWAHAFQENLLGPPLLLATLVWAMLRLANRWNLNWNRQWSWSAISLLLVYAIVRNAPLK